MARAYRLSKPYVFTPGRAMALKKARGISASKRSRRAAAGVHVNYSPRQAQTIRNANASSPVDYRFTSGRRRALARARKVNKNKKAEASRQRRNRNLKIAGAVAVGVAAVGVAGYHYKAHQNKAQFRQGSLEIRGAAIVRRAGVGASPQLALPIGKTARREMKPSTIPRGGVIKVNERGIAAVIKRPRVKRNARNRRLYLMAGVGM